MASKMELEVVNPHCAGIDVGSRSHFVAIGQGLSDVKEFGVYADDLTAICLWLRENGITSVAMESTGPYWQNLYVELSKHGFELVLANGKFTKQPKGKKTDVTDSRWIQKLHALCLVLIFVYRLNNKFRQHIDAPFEVFCNLKIDVIFYYYNGLLHNRKQL
jgi:hypothetical protein